MGRIKEMKRKRRVEAKKMKERRCSLRWRSVKTETCVEGREKEENGELAFGGGVRWPPLSHVEGDSGAHICFLIIFLTNNSNIKIFGQMYYGSNLFFNIYIMGFM